jgi:hypothetical protein
MTSERELLQFDPWFRSGVVANVRHPLPKKRLARLDRDGIEVKLRVTEGPRTGSAATPAGQTEV